MTTLKRNFNYIIVAIGIVMIWRGIWGLLDIYLLPNSPVAGLVISIVIGLVILLMNNPGKGDIEELV